MTAAAQDAADTPGTSGPPDAPAALVVRAGEQVIEGTGEERLTHLDATTTQALKDARPGLATAALVLDANGNPLAMFDVLVLPDRVWLITPDEEVTGVVMQLIAGRTFLADARFAILDHQVARVHAGADLAHRAWSGVAVAPEPDTVRTTPSGDVAVAADDAGTLTIAGPSDEIERMVAKLVGAGAVEGGESALAGWRIAAGRPAWGTEVTPPHLPEELGLLPTHVHLAKGCYPGQEAVARMWMLGRPRRRLARVRITGPDAVHVVAGWSAGTGRELVEVTTVGPTSGEQAEVEAAADADAAGAAGAIGALAFVPGRVEVGDVLGDEASAAVEVVALVGDDPQPPGHDPAMRRRRDRDRNDIPKAPRITPAG